MHCWPFEESSSRVSVYRKVVCLLGDNRGQHSVTSTVCSHVMTWFRPCVVLHLFGPVCARLNSFRMRRRILGCEQYWQTSYNKDYLPFRQKFSCGKRYFFVGSALQLSALWQGGVYGVQTIIKGETMQTVASVSVFYPSGRASVIVKPGALSSSGESSITVFDKRDNTLDA